jgi:hypothetical protein
MLGEALMAHRTKLTDQDIETILPTGAKAQGAAFSQQEDPDARDADVDETDTDTTDKDTKDADTDTTDTDSDTVDSDTDQADNA